MFHEPVVHDNGREAKFLGEEVADVGVDGAVCETWKLLFAVYKTAAVQKGKDRAAAIAGVGFGRVVDVELLAFVSAVLMGCALC